MSKKIDKNKFFEGPTPEPDLPQLWRVFWNMLKPEKSFYIAAIVYGLGLSLLSLAVPISVQMLINTVANTALVQPLVTLSVTLLILLLILATLYLLQVYLMEIFEQRFFARIVTDAVFKTIYARDFFFRNVNSAELMNRYFDIMTVQKNLPHLITGGFALILQMVVGVALVSMYHPFFLIFNVLLMLSVYAVWRGWGRRAIKKSVSLSTSKYDVVGWLEELAWNNSDFKSRDKVLQALTLSEAQIATYIKNRRSFFKLRFAQMFMLVVIYAVFSSALLGLGGYLVIIGQLSLGQLIAAELVLMAVLVGISRSGHFLNLFYELLPAAEKISQFYRIPSENASGAVFSPSEEGVTIDVQSVGITLGGQQFYYNYQFKPGDNVLASVNSHLIQEEFIDFLLAHQTPDSGEIFFDGEDITRFDVHTLRDHIALIDDNRHLALPIDDLLRLSKEDLTTGEMRYMLKKLLLDDVVDGLPEKEKTIITATGAPLSKSESIRLKLARALLRKPKILILTEVFDYVGHKYRQEIMHYLCSIKGMTLIYFTNRRDLDCFDKYLYFNYGGIQDLPNLDELRKVAYNPERKAPR